MNIARTSGIALQLAMAPAWAAGDLGIERLATCQDSWLDWERSDPAQLKTVLDHIRSDFTEKESDPFWLPKTEKSVAGLRVEQLFPESVGMGVGFSVVVKATFDETRRHIEKTVGKALTKCETGDNMRMCEREIAEKRTLMLMAEDNPKSTSTLVGCYYYYEK